jgi:predicted DNA-binding protein YlxM (UPF0122 family)
MEDVVLFNELYDLYSGLLTEKQREYFEDYYFNNMSFSEMAEDYDVSRNAVFKQVHIVTDKLVEYESILHLKEKKDRLDKILEDAPIELKQKIEELM